MACGSGTAPACHMMEGREWPVTSWDSTTLCHRTVSVIAGRTLLKHKSGYSLDVSSTVVHKTYDIT